LRRAAGAAEERPGERGGNQFLDARALLAMDRSCPLRPSGYFGDHRIVHSGGLQLQKDDRAEKDRASDEQEQHKAVCHRVAASFSPPR
jgi:hypothetical protein